MNTQRTCPECGKPVGSNGLEGLCPACMMRVASSVQTGEVGPEGTQIVESNQEPAPSPAEVARLFPQLEIVECLGRGGMGIVYKARQPQLNRFVALKLLAPEKQTKAAFAARFVREAQALARLSHPAIVAVYDFGEVGGLCYLIMECVDGRNLRHLIRSRELAPEQALAVVPKICEALQYAHEHGVVHRDIKPENIMIDAHGGVKITDFGIAKMLGRDSPQPAITLDHQVIGTPHYMAPEQVEKPRQVDHRADIYSLGVVFYEMLTGELPLGKFAPPSTVAPVDTRVDNVVLHALEKNPEQRYQQASEVKSDLEEITRVPPLQPPGADASFPSGARRRSVKRGQLVALVAVAAGVVGLALLAAFFANWRLGTKKEPARPPANLASGFVTGDPLETIVPPDRSRIGPWGEPIPPPTEFMAFPDDSGAVNVQLPPYNAKGDGVTDDTAAIQKAFDDHPGQHAIIYLPNGVYLVSDTLRWGRGDAATNGGKFTTLQGTSRNATIIRLRDSCPGFGDVNAPRPVLSTGTNNKERDRNSIRYLTVYTGRNNPGATGIQFNSRNGRLHHMLIRSGEGEGIVGLDMSQGEETGPIFVKNVTVHGFNIGIATKNVLLGQTFEHLTLEGQRQAGLLNAGQTLSIRDLKSRGQAPAIRSISPTGLIVLVDSRLQADTDVPFAAIENHAGLFLRDVTVRGFALALKQTGANPGEVPAGFVAEWTSHPMPGSKPSLNLPVKETAQLPWDLPKEWANVMAFHTDPGSRDVSDALQRAIDSGKTTVYFPRGNYVIAKLVELRGQVRRVIGCEAVLQLEPPDERQPLLTLGPGNAPAVAIERLTVDFPASARARRFIDNPSGRTLMLRDCQGVDSEFTGPGEIFLEGVEGRMIFHGQKVWARQFSQTTAGSSPPDQWWHVRNEGGVLWVLGELSAGPGPVVSTTQGGQTEVLGGLIYSSGGGAEKQPQPAFAVEDGALAVSVGEVSFTKGLAYPVLVRDTRAGETRDVLLPSQAIGGGGASLIPLFSTDRISMR